MNITRGERLGLGDVFDDSGERVAHFVDGALYPDLAIDAGSHRSLENVDILSGNEIGAEPAREVFRFVRPSRASIPSRFSCL